MEDSRCLLYRGVLHHIRQWRREQAGVHDDSHGKYLYQRRPVYAFVVPIKRSWCKLYHFASCKAISSLPHLILQFEIRSFFCFLSSYHLPSELLQTCGRASLRASRGDGDYAWIVQRCVHKKRYESDSPPHRPADPLLRRLPSLQKNDDQEKYANQWDRNARTGKKIRRSLGPLKPRPRSERGARRRRPSAYGWKIPVLATNDVAYRVTCWCKHCWNRRRGADAHGYGNVSSLTTRAWQVCLRRGRNDQTSNRSKQARRENSHLDYVKRAWDE